MARSFSASQWRPSTWRVSLLRRPRDAGVSRASEWGASTYEGLRWERARHAGRRWAICGAVLGGLLGVIAFAPAAWNPLA